MQPRDPYETNPPEENQSPVSSQAPPSPTPNEQQPSPQSVEPASVPPPSPQAYSPGYSSQPANSKKKILIFAVVGGVVLLGLIIALFVINSGKPESSKKSSSSQNITSNAAPAGDDKKLEPAQLVRTPINKSVVTDFGYGIQADELITGFVPKHPESAVDVVIFKVTITENQKPEYTGSDPAAIYFAAVAGDKEYERSTLYAGASQKELADAGYPAPEGKPRAGAPVTGYLSFGIPKGSKPTILRYKQKETKILNNGSMLPAKNYDIVL